MISENIRLRRYVGRRYREGNTDAQGRMRRGKHTESSADIFGQTGLNKFRPRHCDKLFSPIYVSSFHHFTVAPRGNNRPQFVLVFSCLPRPHQ